MKFRVHIISASRGERERGGERCATGIAPLARVGCESRAGSRGWSARCSYDALTYRNAIKITAAHGDGCCIVVVVASTLLLDSA